MRKSLLPYQNPALPVKKRVEDLLARMTNEEKVGQMCQIDGRIYRKAEFRHIEAGSLLQVLNGDTEYGIERARKTRLGIPLLLGVDAIHGHSFQPGATIFPTQLGSACSWDAELLEEIGAITAKEMRYTGVAWTFSPVFCLARDLRWGRCGETFGEDPLLAGDLGCALIRGLQGKTLSGDPDKVMACAKHYVAYCETEGGRDASECDLTHRKIRSFLMPPFQRAAEAGTGSFMTGYQSTDGLPMTVNRWGMRDVLRGEWGYTGMTVTDWANVQRLVDEQKVCADIEEAAIRAVTCGNDMIMSAPKFYEGCLAALKHGKLDIKLVDEAVRRILTVKFKLGLFEDPRRADAGKNARILGTKAHRAAALRAARESLVLLQNDGILPLKNMENKRIVVAGIYADDPLAQNGDWSLGTGQANAPHQHPRKCTVTILDAMNQAFPGQVQYRPAANFYLKEEDLIIAVVGDSRIHYAGECCSTATLELQDGQKEMLNKIAESGVPFIIVLQSTKPMILPELVRRLASAIIVQFSPGMLGGQALADAVTGRINPSGRLPVSMPYHAGQLPVYYNQIRGQHGCRYADMTQDPVYAFGEGMGYAPMTYVSAKLNRNVYSADDTIELRVRVRNDGSMDGVEVVQAYLSDLVTSVTWTDLELKGYQRLSVPAGKTATAVIRIPVSDCSIVNADEKRVVEPGEFELRVGPSSRKFPFVLKFTVKPCR